MKRVCIVGLGYVGLPVLCLCAKKGFPVVGFDVDQDKIKTLQDGICPLKEEHLEQEFDAVKDKATFTTNASEAISEADIVVICVPTPVDEQHHPDLDILKSATETVASSVKPGALLCIESTIFPGTIEDVLLPLLEGKDISVAHCPERIDPGNKTFTLASIPRVVAGLTEEDTKRAVDFYSSLIDAPITALNSPKAAEATKMMENTFRDINIAFINEMAKSFDKAGIDIMEVIKGATTKPFAFMAHYPGIGVGGHCIPVDPYYLIERAKEQGFDHKFLSLAREINESMPSYSLELLENELKKLGKSLEDVRVGILGLSYKADIDDRRESPAYDVIALLQKRSIVFETFDPHLSESTVSSLDELFEKSDVLILVTAHSAFTTISPAKLAKHGIVVFIDGRNCLSKNDFADSGVVYKGIGH